jgi:hypothetical protein
MKEGLRHGKITLIARIGDQGDHYWNNVFIDCPHEIYNCNKRILLIEGGKGQGECSLGNVSNKYRLIPN